MKTLLLRVLVFIIPENPRSDLENIKYPKGRSGYGNLDIVFYWQPDKSAAYSPPFVVYMLLPYTTLASLSEVVCCALVYVSYNNRPEPLLREDNNDKFEIFSPGREAVVKMRDDI